MQYQGSYGVRVKVVFAALIPESSLIKRLAQRWDGMFVFYFLLDYKRAFGLKIRKSGGGCQDIDALPFPDNNDRHGWERAVTKVYVQRSDLRLRCGS